jgi:hypothetical protein
MPLPPHRKKDLASAASQTAFELRESSIKAQRTKDQAVRKAVKEFARRAQAEADFTEKHGHVRPALATKWGDKWMFSIGASIYVQDQEGPYDFLNVLHGHALDFLGMSFIEAEQLKGREERHPGVQWMLDTVEDSQRSADDAAKTTSVPGSYAAWFRFAHDLFTIADNAQLQRVMKGRLTNARAFQGARHELRVAALCIAAGFKLEFQDESDPDTTHFEFVATDPTIGVSVAVEAKSRHRKGVQGFKGGKDVPPGELVGIRDLVIAAYQKKTDLPLYAFIDVNLPPADEHQYTRWSEEIDATMADLIGEGYTPSDANAVFFSNDPSHFPEVERIGGPNDFLWMKYVRAENPRAPHPEPEVIERFMKAFAQRVAAPKDLIDSARR